MAILTEADIAIYAPTITATGAVLDAQIAIIQAAMESPNGANRPLELQSFVDVRKLNRATQSIYLRYLPIAENPALTVEVRVAHSRDQYHHLSGVDDWEMLSSDEWILNETGRLDLDAALNRFGFSRQPSKSASATEIRATYTSGFDFSASNPDTNLIKAIAGQALTYQSSSKNSGVKRQKVDGEYEVEWETGSSAGTFPDSMFLSLKKYAPRAF